MSSEGEGRDLFDMVFGPVVEARSYMNLLYLLISFPLGIAYFVVLVTGFSTGVGLSVMLIGIPIIAAVFVLARQLGAFERWMARSMLGVEISPAPGTQRVPGLLAWIKATLGDPLTWKTIGYLIAKFPMGIFAFVVVVTGFTTSAVLLLAPFTYQWLPITVGPWRVESSSEATFLSAVGLVLAIGWLHAVNGIATMWARFAQIMLNR